MSEPQKNLWAPWRMQYIESLTDRPEGCFLCRYRDQPQDDRENLVLHRTERAIVLLNRFPYSNGHVLVAPLRHEAQLESLESEVLSELMCCIRDAKRVLERAIDAHGFNIGINLGRCAGAGHPDHLHWHVVPRWNGDTNFMPILGDVKVIPEALEAVFAKYLEAAAELGL